MLKSIIKTIFNSEPAEEEAKNQLEADIIYPFEDGPVKLDCYSLESAIDGIPKYLMAPSGRAFSEEEEELLERAMVRAVKTYYGKKKTDFVIRSFKAVLIRECRRHKIKNKKYEQPSQRQLYKINRNVTETISDLKLRGILRLDMENI
jgi:hypothetical protein